MKKHWMTLFVAVMVLAMAGSADARGRGRGPGSDEPGMGPGMHGGGPGMMMGLGPCVVESPELGLSDDQKATLKKLFDEGRDAARDTMEKGRKLHKELRALFVDPKATEAQIRAKAAAIRDDMKAVQDARLDQALKARKVLTAEQLAKLPDVRKECRGRRGDGPKGDRPSDCGRPGPGPRWTDDPED